jgi:hypothetical protein
MFSDALTFTVYSARRATTGSSLAACDAGYQPEAMPTNPETASDSATYPAVMCRDRSKTRPRTAVHARQHDGLDEDLQHDIAVARAERLAHADFARTLGDADQHDVHDHDAAHHQRNAGHRHHHGGDHSQHLVDKDADGVGREGVEVVLLAGAGMEPGAQRHARFIERLLERKAAAGFGPAEEREAGARPVQPVESGDGDIRGVVLVPPEYGAEALLHADDGELDALDADDAAERRGVAAEERRADGVADDRDIRARALLLRGEKAAIGHADVADIGHGGRYAQNGGVFAGLVVALHVGNVLPVRAVEHGVAVDRFQKARIVVADGLVALDLVEVLALVQTAVGDDLGHHERFRAERLGGALLRIDAEPGDGRAHQDHAGYADDHAQQREETPELVGAYGVHRHAERILELIPVAEPLRACLGHLYPG